jgi:hypothetical protein
LDWLNVGLMMGGLVTALFGERIEVRSLYKMGQLKKKETMNGVEEIVLGLEGIWEK